MSSSILHSYNSFNYFFVYQENNSKKLHICKKPFITSLNSNDPNNLFITGQIISSNSFSEILNNNIYYNFYILQVPNDIDYDKLQEIFIHFIINFDYDYIQSFDIYITEFKLHNMNVSNKLMDLIYYKNLNDMQITNNYNNHNKFIMQNHNSNKNNNRKNCILTLYANIIKVDNKDSLIVSTPCFMMDL